MKTFLLLALFAVGTSLSDIARQYPTGSEPAKGGQSGGQPEQAGKEKASHVNQHLAHIYADLAR